MQKNDSPLDNISKKIIRALQHNARISNRDLAELIHLSPSACLKRTKKLEEQGYIRHYTMELDLNRICSNVMVMAHIKLSDLSGLVSASRLEMRLKQIPCAVECFKVSGEVDYIVHFICRSIKHYNTIIEDLMSGDIGISNITSHFVMSTPKPFQQYPLDELNWLENGNEQDGL